MVTIAEPKQHIHKVIGKQKIRTDNKYRLMRYVLRVDSGGEVLLQNVITGQLVVLNQGETKALECLPLQYTPEIEQLVKSYYLVPVEYDEHKTVVNLRRIFRIIDESRRKKGHITQYTILPTTGCNANCYYCYEQGLKRVTMSEKTADETVSFISKNCGSQKKVVIQWFGGEPTVAANRIDQICYGLQQNNIEYASTMISNGYLFDDDMVKRASDLWHLKSLQISVDGIEERYNRIKAYSGRMDNPFKRVMANVEKLIDNRISVGLRMNFNQESANDFSQLLQEVERFYSNSDYIEVYAYPILGQEQECDIIERQKAENWQAVKMYELNTLARDVGAKRIQHVLPSLTYEGCSACSDSYVVIMPDGRLVKCAEKLDEENTVGHLLTGLCSNAVLHSWKKFADYEKCINCVFYPTCIKMENCPARDRCLKIDRNHEYMKAMINVHRKVE